MTKELELDEVAMRFRRASSTEPEWSAPSNGTWQAIAAAVGVDANPASPAQNSASEPSSGSSGGTALSRRAWMLGFGGLVLGAGIGAAAVSRVTRDDGGEQVVRRAALTPLDAPDNELGSAELLRRNGAFSLAVDVPQGLNNPDGYVEVWLINTDLQRMVSVGIFAAGSRGQFLIEQSLIDEGYTIVDLSNEAFDDEPRHSGDTILRGELVA